MPRDNEIELNHVAIMLREGDDVAVAKQKILSGTTLHFDGGQVTLPVDVPAGHKLALHPIRNGRPVRKYGQISGYASANIAPGEWVHTQNLGFGKGSVEGAGALALDYEYSTAIPEVQYVPAAERRTF